MEPVRLRGGVELAPEHAAARLRDACLRVDGDGLEPAEVDQHPVVAGTETGDAVAAPTDRDDEPVLAGGTHGCDDVSGGRAAGDHCRATIDHRVEHPARFLVAGLLRPEHLAREPVAQRFQRIDRNHDSSFARSSAGSMVAKPAFRERSSDPVREGASSLTLRDGERELELGLDLGGRRVKGC
jgi:hypothetical protein